MYGRQRNRGESMRSIGKVKIKKLRKIVAEEFQRVEGDRRMDTYGMNIRIRAVARVPSEWYDTWESAWSEIPRLIDDMMREEYRIDDLINEAK